MADEEKGGAPTPPSARLPSARSPVASAKPALIRVHVHVMDAVLDVSCGEGTNTVRWMAHVAIAMYDRAGCKGYLQLGAPTQVVKPSLGLIVPLDTLIKDIFDDGDHVVVETSLGGAPVDAPMSGSVVSASGSVA